MQIKPLRNLILLEPLPEAQKSAGGLHLPESKDKYSVQTRLGRVVASGPDCASKPGDYVMYRPFDGLQVATSVKREVILSETEVLAIVSKEEA